MPGEDESVSERGTAGGQPRKEDRGTTRQSEVLPTSTQTPSQHRSPQQLETAGAYSKQSEAKAIEARLNENGITIESSGNCRDPSKKTCTSVEGMRQATVDGIIAFRTKVGTDLVITGGTEVGHESGAHSHAKGYKVDIRLNDTINSYIENKFTYIGKRKKDGASLYKDKDGNEFAREGNHWDITFY